MLRWNCTMDNDTSERNILDFPAFVSAVGVDQYAPHAFFLSAGTSIRSGVANLYARCPYVVVGYRHPSRAEGQYFVPTRGVYRIVQVDFGEYPFRNCLKSLGRARGVAPRAAKKPLLPSSCSAYQPNPRLERRSNHFSDSFSTHSGEQGQEERLGQHRAILAQREAVRITLPF